MRPRTLTLPKGLKPAKYQPKLLVGWKAIDGIPHGALTLVIVHSSTEHEHYVLQQCPKKFFLQLLCLPEPEVTMNALLKMYLGDGSQ